MQTYAELAQEWAIDKPTLERARTALGDNLTQGTDYHRGENNSILWLTPGAEKLRTYLQSRGQLPLAAVPESEGTDITAIVEIIVDTIAPEIADQVTRLLPRRIYGLVYGNLLQSFTRPVQPFIRSVEAIGQVAGKS